jgi:transposase InsO family protein
MLLTVVRTLISVFPSHRALAWHREGFRLYWRWKSRSGRPGRPKVAAEVRELIGKLSEANPLWGAPRIHGELRKLGIEISQAAVSKYLVRPRKPPSQSWRTFLQNHPPDIIAIDFFTVPTATLRILVVFLVLGHHRRRVLHFNVGEAPSAGWTGQQIGEAFPWGSAPRFLLRDRDGIYGADFTRRVAAVGMEQIVIAARSPWQNPFVERVIGSLRRECLDHVIVLNERHLRRLLKECLAYYHGYRTHLGLGKDCPETRAVEPPGLGCV